MSKINNVSIGIQARSTSQRFPRKVFELIGQKPMLQHVIDAALSSAQYCNNFSGKNKAFVNVNVLVPHGDEIVKAVKEHRIYLLGKDMMAQVFEGSEHDVLSRYAAMATANGSDYIVRVTADCPLIPPFLISKLITTTIMNGYDYCSNVDERLRTSADGIDCEVISHKALDWLDQNAKGVEREHVTLLFRKDPPKWAKVGHVVGFLDLSSLKLSVDTKEDLEAVRSQFDKIQNALEIAESLCGKSSVHRV